MTHNPPTSQLDLDAIQARIDAASKGPWKLAYEYCDCSEDCGHGLYVSRIDTGSGPATELCDLPRGEWELMVHARADVEQLVAEVRRLRAELAVARTKTLATEADEIVLHCPDHGPQDQDGCWMDCHCAVADDIRRRLAQEDAARPAVRPAVETGA